MPARPQPQRKCLGCGQSSDKRDLMRVVRGPDGEVRLDPTGRLNGRGAYVCRKIVCLDAAIKHHSLERALEVPVPHELLDTMRQILANG